MSEFGGETIGLAGGGSLFESIHCRFAAASLIGKPCNVWFWPVSLGSCAMLLLIFEAYSQINPITFR
jgi:hypothetical protein